MIFALLLAMVPVTAGSYVKAHRDNVLVASASYGHLPILAQIVPGTPFGGGSGGGGGAPGGAVTNIQYNNAGAFGGSANFTWNDGTSTFTVAGSSVFGTMSSTGKFTLTNTTTAIEMASANVEISFANYAGGAISERSEGTPDQMGLWTGATSNAWLIAEVADRAFDFAHAATSNPTLFIQSADQVTTEYMGLSTENSVGMGQIATLKGGTYIGGSKTNITEGSAQAIATFTMAALGSFGATVFYTVSDNDGTDIISRSGNIVIQGVDKAATTTCTIATTRDQETEDGSSAAVSGGALTLTYTWTMVAAANTCAMSLNGASSAGANTYDITYNIQLMADATITVTPN